MYQSLNPNPKANPHPNALPRLSAISAWCAARRARSASAALAPLRLTSASSAGTRSSHLICSASHVVRVCACHCCSVLLAAHFSACCRLAPVFLAAGSAAAVAVEPVLGEACLSPVDLLRFAPGVRRPRGRPNRRRRTSASSGSPCQRSTSARRSSARGRFTPGPPLPQARLRRIHQRHTGASVERRRDYSATPQPRVGL